MDKHIAKGLFVFDLKGVFLYKIGSIGSGPGEFTAISDFTIDTDKGVVYTLDNNTQIVHAYQLQNRLDCLKRLKFQAFLRPTVTVILLSVLPLLFQPNLGGTILVMFICLMMHAENRGWRYPVLGGLMMAAAYIFLIWVKSYKMRHFLAFRDPFPLNLLNILLLNLPWE